MWDGLIKLDAVGRVLLRTSRTIMYDVAADSDFHLGPRPMMVIECISTHKPV